MSDHLRTRHVVEHGCGRSCCTQGIIIGQSSKEEDHSEELYLGCKSDDMVCREKVGVVIEIEDIRTG